MKILLFTVVMSLSVGLLTVAANAQMPPLIDRQILFGNPEIAAARLSPDGKYIAFLKPYKDTRNVWVKGVDEPFEKARLMTNRTDRPIGGFFWSRDSKFVLFVQDKGGDENFNVFAVNPAEKPAEGREVPNARNITDAKGVRAMIFAVPESDPNIIYVGINERDKAWHDVYKVNISTGERTLVAENKDRYQGVYFDNADKLRLATRSAQNGNTEILRIDEGGKTTKIYECTVFEECGVDQFHKDDKRVYIQTNKGDVDLAELVLLDVATGEATKVESDPLKRVDFGGAMFSDKTKEMVGTMYMDDKLRIYWKNKEWENDYKWLQKQLGGKDVSFGSMTTDESKAIVTAMSDTEPGETYIFDRKAKKLTLQYKSREKLDRNSLSPMKAVRYKSSDGLEIPAYLTIPKGSNGKNLPTVLFIHGGPWGRDTWGYHSYAQFLANRGYAVLQPNFRASTGYGKKFLNAGNNEWGQKMQDDITWGKKYLVEQGIADPKRVAIMGGSYGGYAALAGAAFTPDEYAASIAIVPPSNLQTLLEAIPPYWEAIRTVFYKRMGDPNTPEGLAQMKRQSPLYSADKIKMPLMVVQGANDPRVAQRESDQIVEALTKRNFPVEYLLAPDEGHGFQRPVNNMAMVAAAEKFLAKYIGGRYQESMADDVAKRLKEITVDPKTVTVKKADDKAASGETANINGSWDLNVDAGDSIPVAFDVKQTDATFTADVSTPMGNGIVEKGVIKGNTFEGVLTIDVQGQTMQLKMSGKIEGDKMSGTLIGPGAPMMNFSGSKAKK